jgi:preprotein translocase subunit YajC
MDILAQLFPFIALFAIMYFIIIRPQQQQVKKHSAMVESLAKGDKIVTTGGFIVDIKKIEDKFFTVTLANNSEAKLDKDSVTRKYEDEA